MFQIYWCKYFLYKSMEKLIIAFFADLHRKYIDIDDS